ncbi:hypothetical protein A6V36_05885 [Paraburkholderia ginsengiterrae]|uniref:DUF4440 domain-containing protein n=1 Tax=Paraburkholderia ginsengiterrae TaxID=1462993 RepID=A0A1A9NGW9_9BURK|nr:nuclear transport factor 2 family protein [Paraburkholderia ginsengiterrae]OAJ58450.1 hypothetical protein A6V36_05885 [Paraburkholderia ginsengiterrae]OAJ65670.1 hypothetical protein A6V37_13905 [Paraburkholderia ginsengiterrae]
MQADATFASIEQAWVDAAIRGDRATLDQLLDDSFAETMPNGARRTNADVLFALTWRVMAYCVVKYDVWCQRIGVRTT